MATPTQPAQGLTAQKSWLTRGTGGAGSSATPSESGVVRGGDVFGLAICVFGLATCREGGIGILLSSVASLGRGRFRAHHVSLPLQAGIVVNGYALGLHGRLHTALMLLDNVPRLVGQVFLLAGRQVDIRSLRVGQGVELCRFS